MEHGDVLPPPVHPPSPTIYDVASASGVSPSTVSRAFSRPGRVRAETAAHIHRIADDLGYRRTPPPRPGTPTSTGLLALVASDLSNSFFLQIMGSAQRAAAHKGQLLVVVDSQESGELERHALERLIGVVDGAVLATSRMSDAAIRSIAARLPLVLLNRPMADVPSLITDTAGAMRAAVGHLADLGHTAVTYVAGPEASWADGMRWASVRGAAADHRLRARRIGPYPPTLAGGRAAATAFGERPTTSVIGYNDLISIGLLRELTWRGVRVPEDVSIIGHDNILEAAHTAPTLTSVATPLERLGRVAVEMLQEQATASPGHRSAVAARTAKLPAELVLRGSTGPAARTAQLRAG
ncbi:LacI family DNA-binding transcriptional regulator [Sanguibacter gelidistatuariae]|nr:LacI family DNA-binding transcriptional regulator [Sanguibacter gelidistatuariae]